jgi:hypothetical protein
MDANVFTPTTSRSMKTIQMLVALIVFSAGADGKADDPCDLLDNLRDRIFNHETSSLSD